MDQFRKVCRVEELSEGESKAVLVGDKMVAVFRQQDTYFAIDDTCPHMGASLSGGAVVNGIVTCPWHAWRFRLADGAWADNPRIQIGCHAVRVVGDDVEVQLASSPPPAKAGGKPSA